MRNFFWENFCFTLFYNKLICQTGMSTTITTLEGGVSALRCDTLRTNDVINNCCVFILF